MLENGGMSHEPATELDEQLFLAALQTADPVTVRLYGVKDTTLPAYLLLLAATVIVVFGLVAVAAEIVSPKSTLGERVQRMALSEPGALELAIWTPPVLLVGLGGLFPQAPDLDTFHVGLLAAGPRLCVRHASRSAREVVDNHEGPIHVILCDLVLPGLGGREAANTLVARHPEARVLYFSGYSTHDSFRQELESAGQPFLSKPFQVPELLAALEAVLKT